MLKLKALQAQQNQKADAAAAPANTAAPTEAGNKDATAPAAAAVCLQIIQRASSSKISLREPQML